MSEPRAKTPDDDALREEEIQYGSVAMTKEELDEKQVPRCPTLETYVLTLQKDTQIGLEITPRRCSSQTCSKSCSIRLMRTRSSPQAGQCAEKVLPVNTSSLLKSKGDTLLNDS